MDSGRALGTIKVLDVRRLIVDPALRRDDILMANQGGVGGLTVIQFISIIRLLID